ncbi:MAG: protein kinase domain-containing protein [Akkermansiaceae bacterium]
MSTDPEEFTPPSIAEIAKLLPAYEVDSFIAKGGMGAVYMARQKSLDRLVAIKILPLHFGNDPVFRESFEKEAKSMAKFNHPNLISIYDFGQIEGLYYIIMEMVQGNSLYYSCYGKKIDPIEANRIIVETCNGLDHAHKHGILHRDIKPANILLDPSASPKIGDFGLARGVEDQESEIAFGTPGYTAPEVLNNPKAVCESTDIYSVGIMLYELLTSKIPETPYQPVTSIIPCDARYDRVIQKAIHPTPSFRYQKIGDMADDLKKIISEKAPSTSLNTGPATRPLSNQSKATAQAIPSDNTFTRNIIVIIILLGCIFAAWQGVKVVEAKRKKELVEAETATKGTPTKLTVPEIKDTPKKETSLEGLRRLKSQLILGKLSEMPEGTITKNGTHYLFINKLMSWYDAQNFCIDHGGNLAVFSTKKELTQFCKEQNFDNPVWVGAGSAGNNQWQWIDGTEWQHGEIDSSKLSFLNVDKKARLKPRSPLAKQRFYITWSDDGKIPTDLFDQLQRTRDSLTSETPQFPSGTAEFEGAYYFIIKQKANWSHASELAKIGGGSLAKPTSAAQKQWLNDTLTNALAPEKLWTEYTPDDVLPYFVIEWNNDDNNPSVNKVETDRPIDDEVSQLRDKCTEVLEGMVKDYNTEYAKNIQAFQSELERPQLGTTNEARKNSLVLAAEIIAGCKNNRIDPSIIDNVPYRVLEVCKSYIAKEQIIDAQMQTKIGSIRTSYVKKLESMRAEFEQESKAGLVKRASEELERANTHQTDFLEYVLSNR